MVGVFEKLNKTFRKTSEKTCDGFFFSEVTGQLSLCENTVSPLRICWHLPNFIFYAMSGLLRLQFPVCFIFDVKDTLSLEAFAKYFAWNLYYPHSDWFLINRCFLKSDCYLACGKPVRLATNQISGNSNLCQPTQTVWKKMI